MGEEATMTVNVTEAKLIALEGLFLTLLAATVEKGLLSGQELDEVFHKALFSADIVSEQHPENAERLVAREFFQLYADGVRPLSPPPRGLTTLVHS
jgi:hypothetical protein